MAFEHRGGLLLAAIVLLTAGSAARGAIDPSNVLVVYNEASPAGIDVAYYYSQVHPGVQLLGLHGVVTDEAVSADYYLSQIRPQILAALDPAIDVIITTKGLPLRIDTAPHTNPGVYVDPFGVSRIVFSTTWKRYSSLESELARIDTFSTWQQMGDQTWWFPDMVSGDPHPANNPYYMSNAEFDHDTYGTRLTARLDGFTVADVTAAIDRAQRAFVGPFGFVVDDDPNAPGAAVNRMEELVNNVLSPRDLPYTDDSTDSFITDAPGPVLGYVGYGVHGGGRPAPDGYLVNREEGITFELADGAIFHTWESFNANSFTEGGNRAGQALVAEWIARGGTAAIGHVEEPHANPVNVTNEDILFQNLLDGKTWVESAWSATQQLSFVNTVVGDPLMVLRELIPGDADKDGLVGEADLALLSANWATVGKPGGAMWGLGDFNCDGLVGSEDLAVLSSSWGATADWFGADDDETAAARTGSSVPEPSTLLSLMIGLAGLICYAGLRRRKRGNIPQ